jgi:phosphoribosylformylglycinamidine synthase
LLFGEAQGRVIVSTANADAVLAIAKQRGVPARVIGKVTAASEGLHITAGTTKLSARIATLSEAYHEALPRAMQRAAAEAVTKDPAMAGGTA